MPIDPLPAPPPTRQDPANFAARGDAFMAALPPFALQAEAARQEIVAAEASVAAAAPAAIAAANYRGEYNPATLYSVGESVSHSGDRWAAKQPTQGNAPTDGSAYWLRITAIPPQAGQAGKFLTTDGASPAWSAPVKSGYQEFTSSAAAWPKPADATWIAVHCVAGGGGGASSSSYAGYGGAGGQGWYRIYRAADLPATIAIVVGAGGAKGAAEDSPASAGGDSSFNGDIARGGRGGSVYTENTRVIGITRSDAVADLNTARMIVDASNSGLAAHHIGGSSVYGGGGGGADGNGGVSVFAGRGSTSSTAGVLGAGGAGGTNRPRSDGGDGVVRVWWW